MDFGIIKVQREALVVHLLLEFLEILQESLASNSLVLDLDVDQASFSRHCSHDCNIALHQSGLVQVDVASGLTPISILVRQSMKSNLVLKDYLFIQLLGIC